MEQKDFIDAYLNTVNAATAVLPPELHWFGTFIVYSAQILLVIWVLSILLDKVFESPSLKTLASSFVWLVNYSWNESHKEPTPAGLITELPAKYQRFFYMLCAWLYGLQGAILILFSLLALSALAVISESDKIFIPGIFMLLALSGSGVFIASLCFGICHQNIKLYKRANA